MRVGLGGEVANIAAAAAILAESGTRGRSRRSAWLRTRAGRDEVRARRPAWKSKIFVAEYRVRLPTAERIKERLRELADASDGDETT